MTSSRVLVTGGCGFIGTNLIRYLLGKYSDLSITNVDKLSFGANEGNLADVRERYRFVRGDIVNQEIMGPLVHENDAVFNLAAESHVDRSIADPWPFLESNVRGTVALLELLRKETREVRFVQVSTDEVYGSLTRGSADENRRPNPSSPYAASKAASDAFCQAYFKTYGVNVSICRCTNNFGPYQFPEKLIPKTIIRALLGAKVPLYGRGNNTRDWIHVADHCEAIDTVLRKGKRGEIFNIAAGNELSNLTLVERILEILGRTRRLIEFVEDRPGHDMRYSLNASKITTTLGWRPRHKFAEALRKTVDWYVSNERWWRPLASDDVLGSTPWRTFTEKDDTRSRNLRLANALSAASRGFALARATPPD